MMIARQGTVVVTKPRRRLSDGPGHHNYSSLVGDLGGENFVSRLIR